MGGEWWIHFNLKNKDTFNLKEYQDMLPTLKADFLSKFQPTDGCEVYWCPEESIPPQDNIYARFSYKCSRHLHWNPPHAPDWYLYWDPTIISQEQAYSNLHYRCAPHHFHLASLFVHEKLERTFRRHFDCENALDYDYDYDYESSEEVLDFVACSRECNYCGKCDY